VDLGHLQSEQIVSEEDREAKFFELEARSLYLRSPVISFWLLSEYHYKTYLRDQDVNK